jgi:glycosyltransferase involved in cell wall biosynthesis
MKVSVIVRTYNRAYVLSEAIESALNQTYTNTEIIVVDDASTDNTADVVTSFRDSRIRLIRHDRNRGVAVACNTGISAATGELIAWLDSDDIWLPDKLERQVKFMSLHPEVDAVFSDVEIREGESKIPSLVGLLKAFPALLELKSHTEEYVFSQREMYLCLLEEVPIKPTVLLVRREVFSKVGTFDETSQSGEDWEFLLRLSHSSCFGYINVPLAIHRWMSDATHRKYWIQDKRFLINVLQTEKKKSADDRQAVKAADRGLIVHFKSLAYYYLCSMRRKESISTYILGFKETGQYQMLFQAASALFPVGIRKHALNFGRTLRRSLLGAANSNNSQI